MFALTLFTSLDVFFWGFLSVIGIVVCISCRKLSPYLWLVTVSFIPILLSVYYNYLYEGAPPDFNPVPFRPGMLGLAAYYRDLGWFGVIAGITASLIDIRRRMRLLEWIAGSQRLFTPSTQSSQSRSSKAILQDEGQDANG
jgi:hypothetical protein